MQNLIGKHFDAWLERMQQPAKYSEKLSRYLEDIPEDFNDALLEYQIDLEQQAFYGGFAMGIQLAAECFAENQQIIERKLIL